MDFVDVLLLLEICIWVFAPFLLGFSVEVDKFVELPEVLAGKVHHLLLDVHLLEVPGHHVEVKPILEGHQDSFEERCHLHIKELQTRLLLPGGVSLMNTYQFLFL